ncbi:hypothetical protein LC048_20800 [Mesobacillus subterraneus]|uniref:glycoside hydrolase family 30 protein n=1 Tax=Mesobacillus subterraneus TaxID=285983 RepID=UPI00273FC5DD|nr:hypothetical protein [Mesobacillus subterraneus]WLR54809.1 hypothetical protein LC048_20800 [Mesobacillus subterraneus]
MNTNTVRVWLTKPDKSCLLEEQDSLFLMNQDDAIERSVMINDTQEFQEIDGFGGSLTDSSAWLLSEKLDELSREKVMKQLFDPKEGIGLSYLRQPMGASDFALDNYTYCDMPKGESDYELLNFSIKYDESYIIPMVKKALEINPFIKVMGSPWSPPAWMKTTESVIQGRLKEGCFVPFSNYFVKFIQAYEEAGIPIHAVTLQNEPHFEPEGYPGMRMEPEEQIEIIKNYMGPAFVRNGIQTKILIWDHNWDEPDYPITVLNDEAANNFISGTAFHWYAGDIEAQNLVHNAHSDKDIYFTEASGGCWTPDFPRYIKRGCCKPYYKRNKKLVKNSN